jgi:hypothetical protein
LRCRKLSAVYPGKQKKETEIKHPCLEDSAILCCCFTDHALNADEKQGIQAASNPISLARTDGLLSPSPKKANRWSAFSSDASAHYWFENAEKKEKKKRR